MFQAGKFLFRFDAQPDEFSESLNESRGRCAIDLAHLPARNNRRAIQLPLWASPPRFRNPPAPWPHKAPSGHCRMRGVGEGVRGGGGWGGGVKGRRLLYNEEVNLTLLRFLAKCYGLLMLDLCI